MRFQALLFSLAPFAGVLAEPTPEESVKYLEENAKKDGVITTASGLQYKVLKKGTGKEHPKVNTPCKTHYKGTLINGEQFDSSYDRGEPTTFAPNQVIAGWTEAMQLMVAGDKFELTIPYALAYGENGSPPKIPGKSTLVFVMEIVELEGPGVPAINCNVATLEDCSDTEKAYVEKMKAKDTKAKSKELDRLKKMQREKNIQPNNRVWLDARAKLLGLIVAKDEL